MKPKMNRRDLLDNDNIWNTIITVISECDLSTKDTVLNEAFIVFQYYSELESGGHETLLNWIESYIDEISIDIYLNKLIPTLEKIGAQDYAMIEKRYGQELWRLYVALENDEIEEDEFYNVIKKADDEYHKLNGILENLLKAYFVSIHTDLIDVVED
ncbi:hypothetical protein DV702_14765 [Sporosarcina sp. PTS2304]|uniref:DMP19 family protein n=1 Tax=unclassified Sporosarcina TaxID=2647733 RepID=UPI000E0CE1E2|nr:MULTISPECIES: hypothetical protein [unclassified Sporosarcina]AXI00856.1 hypothetical protein DV702_14765 [Sporosarcina sp. PTS2304]GKV64407.1 hypothetical protein NCCP2331_05600 [Sporosarcina sp. NCCP-2331]GKV65035.1 hypothetical protein NCCP2331_11880 [Sporosarcina sp. NCCP-2331]GLB55152.1 hypothetical protein NCCP2378_09380 [Sporosarcina sp. NCCP-2378]GLB57867.1 hypothetical protein NCCP2378_36620 [Sporosarcina sp. NCCP-2378]